MEDGAGEEMGSGRMDGYSREVVASGVWLKVGGE